MWVSRYVFYFTIYSMIGWIFESTFCSVRAQKWENRGFLFGPFVPIYGFGACGIMALAELYPALSDQWWEIFLISVFGSMILEYVTSWALEKLFHAYWWDYHDKPLNINGRICLPYSLGFGIAGLVVTYLLVPAMQFATQHLTPLSYELLSLLAVAFIAADSTLTVSVLTNFAKEVMAFEDQFNKRMDTIIDTMVEQRNAITEAAQELRGPKPALADAAAELRKQQQEMAAAAQKRREDIRRAMAEERKRLKREEIRQHIDAMNAGHRSALRRVKGFQNTGSRRSLAVNHALREVHHHNRR